MPLALEQSPLGTFLQLLVWALFPVSACTNYDHVGDHFSMATFRVSNERHASRARNIPGRVCFNAIAQESNVLGGTGTPEANRRDYGGPSLSASHMVRRQGWR